MKSSGNPPSLLKFCLLMLMLVSYTDTFVIGAPRGGHVVSGTASFAQDGNLTVITAGNRSVINYTGFDIGRNETVRFIQPGAHATVLNRVTTPDPTNIFGQLQSNGIVVISNPYGVFFRNGSVVNVGGLIAGAGKISDADFTAGKVHFTDLTGDVRNDGVIAADNRIALMGANVTNNGSLTAAHGMAMMVSGPDVYVGDKNGNIFVQANGKALKAAAAAGTTAAGAGSVTNRGAVAAPRVVLGAGDMYSTAIVNSGLLQGRRIAVNAGPNGSATVGGTLDATSAHNPTITGKGGDIDVLGGKVTLQGATLDASGSAGGGNVRVGGDFHGADTLARSATTTVDAASAIRADATGATGDGGTVVLWSTTGTTFAGHISARGGSAGGNGGSVEVSSASTLFYRGFADLTATAGRTGSLLLDPDDIIIDTGGADPLPPPVVVVTPPSSTVTVGFADGPATQTISPDTLSGALATSNVILDANNNIVFRAGVTSTAATSLTLNAGNSIYIGDPGTVGTGAATTAALSLGGAFNATVNATGAAAATRAPGPAVFAMTSGSTLSAPGGVTIGTGTFGGSVAANIGNFTLGAITANGGISVDNSAGAAAAITANGTLDTTPTVTDTPGGNISLKAATGLTLTGTVDASGAGTGNGGTVVLNAGTGDFTANAASTITSNSTGTGNGGNITLSTTGGDLTANGVLSAASLGTGAGAGNGGAVSLTSTTGTVTASAITTRVVGTGDGTAGTGQAGNVTLSSSGLLTVGAITATANVSGAASTTTGGGGAVQLTSSAGGITASTITTSTGNGNALALAGGVTLQANGTLSVGAIDATAPNLGQGGTVQLTSTLGAITTGTVGTSGAGGGGNVQMTSTGDLTPGAITTSSTNGNGGNVTLTLNNGATAHTLTVPMLSTAGGGTMSGSIEADNNDTTAGSTLVLNGSLNTTGTGTDTAGGNVTLTVQGSDLDLGANTITANGAGAGAGGNVTINAGGALTAAGAISATSPTGTGGAISLTGVTSETLSGSIAGGSLNVGNGPITFDDGSSVTTSGGGQTYNGAVTLALATAPRLTTLADTGGGDIQFNSTVDSASTSAGQSLTVNTSGSEIFGGAVGSAFALNDLSTDAAGTVGGAAKFNFALPTATTNPAGVTLTGALSVGDGVNFGVTGGASATAPSISTVGSQTYTGAATVGATTYLTSGSTLAFNSTVSSATATGQALTLDTVGAITLGGGVGTGALNPLASLTTVGGQEVDLNGDGVTTNGAAGQTYSGAVKLGADNTLTATANGPVTFAATIDGNHALTVNTGGLTRFENNVGGATPLASLSVSGAGGISFTPLTGSGITTLAVKTSAVDGQNYTGAVTLGADLSLTAAALGPVTFGSTVDGGYSLTVATGGLTRFAADVGVTTTLTSLSSTGAGGVTFTGPLTVKTSGAQGYAGLLTLGGTTTLTSTGSAVTAGSLAGGGFDLTVNATAATGTAASSFGAITNGGNLTFADGTGTAVFTGAVNAVSLSTTGAGGVTLAGDVTTSGLGGQSYAGPVLLSPATGTATTLTANGGGPVTFVSTVGGSAATEALSLVTTATLPATPGIITFGGAVGPAGAPLASLTTSTGSPVHINGGAVTTTGAQTYGGIITLGSTATPPLTILKGGTLTPGTLINGGGTQSLTLNFTNALTLTGGTAATAGVTTLNGLDNLTSSGAGGTTLQGTLTTAGNQNFADAVTLGANTTLTSNTGTVSANSVAGGGFDLTVNATGSTFGAITNGGNLTFADGAGLATFTGNIGAISLNSTGSGGVTFSNALAVTTTAAQTYTGTLTLGGATSLTGTTITADTVTGNAFPLTVTASAGSSFGAITGAGALIYDGAGSAVFTGPITATSLSVSGGTGVTLSGGTITTSAGQTYGEAVILGADTTLASTVNGDVNLSSTVNSPVARSLTVNTGGITIFGGAVGGTGALASLMTDAPGATRLNGGGVETTGAQIYNDAVTLGADTVLTSDTNGNIQFVSTLDSDSTATPRALTVNTGGTTIFGGLVGATALASLTTDAPGTTQINGGGVTTTGAQTYHDPLSIGANTTLKGSTVSVSSFTGNNFNLTLTFSGPVTANGFTGIHDFTSNGTGGTTLSGNFATSGFQDYENAVTLTANTTLTSTGGGAITFASTVGGPFALSLGTTGIVTFGGAVGTAAVPLTSVTTTGAGEVDLNGGAIITNGSGQFFTGPVVLGATGATPTTTLTAGGAGGNVFFGSTVQGKTGTSQALDVGATGTVTLTGAVGTAITPLASFRSTGTAEVDIKGNTVITNGAAGQFYQGPVVLGSTLATPATTLTAGTGPINFQGTIDGAVGTSQALTLSTTGTTTFGLGVGVGTALASLTAATGPLLVNGGAVKTTGTQTYNGAVTLGLVGAIFTSTGNGAILFNSTLDGGEDLTVNTGGVTTFAGAVGSGTALRSVTTDTAGSTVIGGGAVTTTGGQIYKDPVTLASTAAAPATTTLTAGAAGIDFVGKLDGNAAGTQALVLNTTGTQTFGGVVGATYALASLTTSTGPVEVDGGRVITTGVQVYNGALTLGSNGMLTTTGTDAVASAISFNSTVGGAFALTTVTSGGNTVFGANSGSVTGSLLTGLTTSANGTTIFNNAALTTNGTQTYHGPVVVQSATRVLSLTASTGSMVFDQTLNSTAANSTDLTLTTSAAGSSVTFTGAVGGGITAPSAVALNSLTVNSPTIRINGGVVNTASTNPRGIPSIDGTQTYHGTVLLGTNTTFVGTALVATGIIDAQNHDLTLTLSRLASVPLAGIINLHNFTSNGTGGTNITGNFSTTGFQHYDNFVTISGPATLTAGVVAGQDSISFSSTVDSAGHFALSLNTSGPIRFKGAVGNTGPLGSLTTLGSGTTFLDGGAVTTVGSQTFAAPVVLGAADGQTTLTSLGGGTIRFSATLDGAAAGAQALITDTTGAVEYDQAVGGSGALQSLTANNTGTTNINGGSVTTAGGGQNYNGPVAINTAAATTLSDNTTGNLIFGATLDNFVAGTPTLTLRTGGDITFTGQVGSVGTLGSLTAAAGRKIFVNGGLIRSTGNQTYTNPDAALLGAVSLGNPAAFTSTNGGAIRFHATVDGAVSGAQALNVNTTGDGIFDGVVGGVAALASLTTDAGGRTQFNMAIGTAAAGVRVTGNVTLGDAVVFAAAGGSLAHPTVLSGGSQFYSGGTATQDTFLVGGGTFGNTGILDFGGAHDLSLRFGGLVTVPSGLVNVRNFLTDGAGGTLINGDFTTTGTQTYSDNVSLAGAPTLTSVGNLTFNNPVDGNAPLTLNATGPGAQVIFNLNALVGNTTGIGALTTNSVGGTVFGMDAANAAANKGGVNAASVTVASGPVFFDVANSTSARPGILTTGFQSYQGAATLRSDTILVSSGGEAISFSAAATVDSVPGAARSLTLNTTGAQTFAGVIGSTTPLGGLTTGPGETFFNMTVGTAPAGVRLNGPLTIGGAVTFNEAGSSLAQPSVLTLGNGPQTYGGTVTLLGAVTVLNSASTEPATGTFHGGGTITFNGNIVSGVPVVAATGTPELDVRAGAGTVEFDAPVVTTGDFAPGGASVIFRGSVGPLGTFTVLPNDLDTGIGGVDLNGGSVTTGGSQFFNVPTVLSANTTLQAGGNITFASTLDGSNLLTNQPYALDIKVSGGTIAFNGIVGGIVPLESLTTENVGATVGVTRFGMILPVAGSGLGGVNVINAVNIGTTADFEAVGLAGGTVPTILTGVTYLGQVGAGTQTYGGAVVLGLSGLLGQTTVLRDLPAAGSITFNGRIDGKVDGDAGLSVNAAGDEFFNQLVGDAHPLASLSTDDAVGGTGATRFNMDLTQTGVAAGVRVAGTVSVNDRAIFSATGGLVHPTILSGGAQNYALDATVSQGTVLTIDPALRTAGLPADSGNIIFQQKVDSGATAQDLQVNTPGDEVFDGLVGSTAPLASLTTDATGPRTGQTRFVMTLPLTGLAAGVGAVNTTGGLTINDAVLFRVANTADLPANHPGVVSGGTQTYHGAATLGDLTILTSTGGNIVFNATLDSDAAATPRDLITNTTAVGSLTTFAGAVGGTFPLASLRTNGLGTTQLNGGAVTTTLSQQYFQPVTLGQDTLVRTLAVGGSIDFNDALDGTYNFEVDSDAAVFSAVGGTSPLLNLTTTDRTSARFDYTPALVAAGGAAVNLAGVLTANGPVFFNAANVGEVVFVRTGVTVPGQTPVSAQDYRGAFTLAGNATFTDLRSGGITFRQGLNGASPLGLSGLTASTGGAISFLVPVGAAAPLTSLTTSNLGLATGRTIISGGSVMTANNGVAGATGAQTYNDAVVLGAAAVLTSTVTGGATAGGDIAFNSTVDSNATAPLALTIQTAGRTIFGGAVGAANALGTLTTDNEGPQDLGTFINGGSIRTVNTGAAGVAGTQTYNDAVTLGAAATLTSIAGGSAATGGTIIFNSTLDSDGATTPQALTVNTTGQTIFGGTVGGTRALASLTTDANSDGGQVLFGLPGTSAALAVTTTGAQTYNNVALLQTGTTLTSNNGGTLTFATTIDGPFALSLNSKGDEMFNGQIGRQSALASLSTDADANNAGGNVRFFFNGTNASPSVTTTGAQAYRDPAVLHADTVLASTRGGRLAFQSKVDNNNVNNPHALTLNTAGDELFGGLIGAGKAIGSLTTDASGPTGGQTQFAMNLRGRSNNAAGVNVTGDVTVNDAVFFNAPGASSQNVLVQSTGAQTYNARVILGADAVLASSGGRGLTFNSTVVGPYALALNTGGTTTFNAPVGSGTGNALGGLSTQGGRVALNAGTVTTTGAQSYSSVVMLGRDTRLTSSAGGVSFGASVDGAFALTLATAAATTFNGAVGDTNPLTNLTATDGSGVIVNGGRVTTLGLQTYGGEVTVNRADGGTTVLTATNGGTGSDATRYGDLDFRRNVTVNSGSLLVRGRRILAEANSNFSVAGAGNLDLETSDILILRGASYGSDSGSVTLNNPHNGVDPAAVNDTTIFLTNQSTTFHGGSFDMGYLQNLYSQGSVSINVGGGMATLSDIAASGAINVSAGAIVLRARNADPSRNTTGGQTDDGLNFVSRTSINFGNSAIRYDNTYSNNNVANFVTTTGLVTVNRDQAVGLSLFQDASLATSFSQRDAGLDFTDANFGTVSGFPVQPISGGIQTIDTAAALSGALPDQKPLDVAVDITVTAGQLEELKKLGIHPRRAAKQERVSLSSKRALFAQLVDGQDQDNYGLLQPINRGVSRLVPSDYVVVVDRMSEREVQSILTAFEQLYGKNKEKAAPIGESFTTAFTDYTTEKQTGDPAGFGPYLLEKPGKYPEVDKAIRGFDNLFGYIESLGLTSKEQAKSKEHIASDLQVAGVSPEDMVKVIDTLRAKIPKEQKAPSTKLPPSPPVAAPAPGATNPPPPVQKATPPLKTARQPGRTPTRKTVRETKPVKEDRLHEVAGL